jgi:uncharacterized protein (DUF1684 family)
MHGADKQMVNGMDYLTLLDYRRRVGDMYQQARQHTQDAATRLQQFRAARDELFEHHSQSPLSPEQQQRFGGLRYYPYNPALRFEVAVDSDVAPDVLEAELHDDGQMRMRRCGNIHLMIAEQPVTLSLFWMLGYGGGMFLPFRDRTNGQTTYGGGRYLLDTIKHADLGQIDGRLVVDFNYAYNPSCAYNPRWDCPLAPFENWLPVAIEAGEFAYPADDGQAHESAWNVGA